jgi:hypothetical protein
MIICFKAASESFLSFSFPKPSLRLLYLFMSACASLHYPCAGLTWTGCCQEGLICVAKQVELYSHCVAPLPLNDIPAQNDSQILTTLVPAELPGGTRRDSQDKSSTFSNIAITSYTKSFTNHVPLSIPSDTAAAEPPTSAIETEISDDDSTFDITFDTLLAFGIVIGALVLLLAGLCFFIFKKRKSVPIVNYRQRWAFNMPTPSTAIDKNRDSTQHPMSQVEI